MSNTSAPVPPRLGATPFLYSSVLESKTATLATLPRTAPLRCSTREKRPPSQMLVPTCSIALTRPSIMRVSSGFSDGNARTVPPAKRRATAAESNNKSVLLIPISFFSGAEERMKTPTPYTTNGDNILSLPVGISARRHIFGNATSQTPYENIALHDPMGLAAYSHALPCMGDGLAGTRRTGLWARGLQ